MQRQRRIYLKLILVLLIMTSMILPGSVGGSSFASESLTLPFFQTENPITNSFANTKIDPSNQEIIPEASSLTSSINEETTSTVIPLFDDNGSSEVIFPPITPDSNVTQATYRDLNVEAFRIPRPRTELTDKRDRFSKTFLNPDGTTTVQSAVYSLHYLDKGAWKDINTALRQDRSDGNNTYSMLANRFNVRLNNQSSKQAVTFSVSDQSVTYRALSMKNVTGVVYDNTVIYNEAWKSTDLEYQVQNDQLKMELQLKDNKAPKAFSFQIDAQNVTYDLNPDGSIDFLNQDGEVAFRIPRMWVKDSASDTLMYDRLKVSLKQLKGKNILTVTLDDTGLQYPVTIDPTTEIPAFHDYHSLYLQSDGTVLAWGNNNSGQLGDGTTESRTDARQVMNLTDVSSVYAGRFNSYAIKKDGTVWGWGVNSYAQLGANPSKVLLPIQIQNLTNVKSIAKGEYHVLALKEDGTVWAWGRNTSGQLGIGTNVHSLIPVQVPDLNNVIAIAATEERQHASFALKQDGTVWAWGSSEVLGSDASQNSLVPQQIPSLSNVIRISAGERFAAAVLENGNVMVWGAPTGSLTPVLLNGISNVKEISLGTSFGLALKDDNTVWIWGREGGVPTQVSDLSDVVYIQAKGDVKFAIKRDGSMWRWGYDEVYGTSAVPRPFVIHYNDTTSPSPPGELIRTSYGIDGEVQWLPSTDNIRVVAYDVYLDDVLLKVIDSREEETLYRSGVIKITDDKLYKLTVKARDAAGNISEGSTIFLSSDSIMPASPSNLKITNVTPISVSFSWDPPTDNYGINYYYISVWDQTSGKYFNLSIYSASNTIYTVTGLEASTTYSFGVTAIDTGNNSSRASILGTTAQSDFEPPTPPSAVVVTGRWISGISISWAASTDNVEVASYEIYNGSSLLGTVPSNQNSYHLDTNSKETFYLSVKAKDRAGNVSEASNTVLANTDTYSPTKPTLKIDSRTSTSATISWYGSTDEFGVTHYDIYTDGTILIGTVDGSVRNYTVQLDAGKTYTITVKARDFAGNSSTSSNTVTAIYDILPPSVPTDFVITTVGANSIYMKWSASTDNVGVIGYDIYNGETLIGSTTALKHILSNLTVDTFYNLTVRARDEAGNLSISSNSIQAATDIIAPSAPPNLRVTDRSASSITISWDSSTDNLGVKEYAIYVKSEAPVIVNSSTLSYTIKGLLENSFYSISVVAIDYNGYTAWSHISASTDITNPSTPTNLKVTGRTLSSLKLSWDASTDNITDGVQYYDIYNGSTLVQSVSKSTREYTVTGLAQNIAHTFTVKARDRAENISGASNAVTVILENTPPTAPSNLIISEKKQSSALLTWQASTDNVGVTSYDIYCNTKLIGSVNGLTLQFMAVNLESNTLYNFTVKAKDDAGNISASSNLVRYLSISGKATYQYDVNGRIEAIILANQKVIRYKNDANGNIISVTFE